MTEQLAELNAAGCASSQGSLFAKPDSHEDLEELFHRGAAPAESAGSRLGTGSRPR